VIGSYGKRELLDKKLNRSFINRHTGYMGVKYHIKTKYPDNEIGLDNFPGGYCGIVKIEDDKYNLCYLYKRNLKDEVKSIREIEEKVMFKNPVLKNIFTTSEFLFSKPEVINEISFNKKSCIENRIFLCGDSAGLITPLCGNGMAMAIHAAKILSEVLIQHSSPGKIPELSIRDKAEAAYRSRWNAQFRERLFWGRNLQMISGNATITKSALKIMHAIPKLEKWLIKKTHGSTIS
jgi:flavin-dependent dehydrogenase